MGHSPPSLTIATEYKMLKPIVLFMMILTIPLFYRIYSYWQPVALSNTPIHHLAIIMDGNRRWAKKHNLVAHAGHRKGADTVKWLLRYCAKQGIKIVSIYAFSLENFQRSKEEIQNLFALLIEDAQKSLPDFLTYGIRVRFIGDRKAFPPKVAEAIEKLEAATKDCSKLQLNVFFCYGGRQEILSAVQEIIKDVRTGKLTDITSEELFKKYLWSEDLPDPDLIIRTGGVKRLSNFLTYQTSYSELYFTDRLWPELTEKDLDEALRDYAHRKRNFGT